MVPEYAPAAGHPTLQAVSQPYSFQLQIAGFGLDVDAAPGIDLSAFADRARRYARPEGVTPHERLEIRLLPPDEQPIPGVGRPAARVDAHGEVTLEANGARLRMPAEPGSSLGWVRGDDTRFRFENVLRMLISRRLLQTGGVMLHAAGLVHGATGVAFPGVSGAGKSTLTLRHPHEDRISEDLLAVRRIGTSWVVEALPFIAFHQLDLGPKVAPLRGFAFIRQSDRVAAHPMSAVAVRQALAKTVVAYSSIDGIEPLVLERLIDLSESVPGVALELDLESPLWPELERALPPQAAS